MLTGTGTSAKTWPGCTPESCNQSSSSPSDLALAPVSPFLPSLAICAALDLETINHLPLQLVARSAGALTL